MNLTTNNWSKKTFFIILVIFIIILTTILISTSLVIAANDPGHDTLYVEETGDSEITGGINITQNLSVDGGRIKQGGQLTLYGDGSTPTGSVTYISGTGASNYDLYLETQGNLYLKYVIPGDTVIVGTTGTPTIMNLTGALNLGGANRLYTSAGSEAGSDLFWGDKMICDASESNCGWATSVESSGDNNYTEAISFSGTGTITLNLDRVGMDNLTADFTDTDTTIGNCSTDQSCTNVLYDTNASDFMAAITDNWLDDDGDTGTGNYTFGADNVMHIDDTNNYVGIGTATPSTLFDIQSNSIANQLRVSYDDSNYANFSLGSDGNLTIKATNHIIIDLS